MDASCLYHGQEIFPKENATPLWALPSYSLFSQGSQSCAVCGPMMKNIVPYILSSLISMAGELAYTNYTIIAASGWSSHSLFIQVSVESINIYIVFYLYLKYDNEGVRSMSCAHM